MNSHMDIGGKGVTGEKIIQPGEPFADNLSRREFLQLLGQAAAVSAIPPSSKATSPRLSALSRLVQSATPADYARIASRGRWAYAPHLALTNRYLMALASRKIRRLIVTMPPRHGKSTFISKYFPGWWIGTFPHQKVVIASYGADLATYWSGRCREAYEEFGPQCFNHHIGRGRSSSEWYLAPPNQEGGVMAAGVGGPLTGKGADLMVIDDPVKNNEEANSAVVREKVWEWWLSTASTRLEPEGVVVIMMTRWHHDDLVGRILKEMEQGGEHWHILNLPAIAETDEPAWPNGLNRRIGQALWPDRYNESALAVIKHRLSERWWSALYQQRPSPKEGDMFKAAWFKIQLEYPGLLNNFRFYDFAATEKVATNDPDFTASCKGSKGIDNRFYVFESTVERGTPGYIEDFVISKARMDGPNCIIRAEQEGGSGGKFTIHGLAQRLYRENMGAWSFKGNVIKGSKESRADPLSAAAQHDMVRIIPAQHGDWTPTKGIKRFLECLTSFPNGVHDDEVDAASGCYYFCNLLNCDFDCHSSDPVLERYADYVPR